MSVSQAQREAAQRIAHEIPDIDSTLPIWAQRRNPIILRMLGAHWRVFFPQARPLLKLYLFQIPIVLLTIKFSWMYIVILTFLLPSMVALPYAFYLYLQTIGRTIVYATAGMAEEYENDTLRVLRTTPFTTREIVLSKIAAAVWRQADEIDQLLFYAASLSMPVIMAWYLASWPPEDVQGVNQIMTVFTFASSIIRIPLEVFMIGAVGTLMGTLIRLRSTAFLSTAVLVFFYFLLLNLLRLVDMTWPMQLFVDAFLPIILPIIMIVGAIQFAVLQIEND